MADYPARAPGARDCGLLTRFSLRFFAVIPRRSTCFRLARRQRAAAGFSLVETLLAAVVVAVLAAIALPAFDYARRRAWQTEGASNLRQLAAANLSYAADHDGIYCPAQEPRNLVRWHGARPAVGAAFDPTKGFLADYLGHEGRVKTDPQFRQAMQSRASSTFELGTGGYGYNATYIGGSGSDPFTPARMANIPQPARTVMFTDTAFPKRDGLQEYPYSEPFFWVDYTGAPQGRLDPSVHFRHFGRANVAWCDGHISSESPNAIGGANIYGGDNAKYQIGWFGPEENNGCWKP